MFLDLGTWPSVGWQQQPPPISLSVPFFLVCPPPMLLFLSFSQHALWLCVSYQHVSLSASRCLRQTFLSRKLLQLQSCLLFSIHLSVPSVAGLCPFQRCHKSVSKQAAEPSSGCRHRVSGSTTSQECRSLKLTLHYGETHKPGLVHFARPRKSHVYFE